MGTQRQWPYTDRDCRDTQTRTLGIHSEDTQTRTMRIHRQWGYTDRDRGDTQTVRIHRQGPQGHTDRDHGDTQTLGINRQGPWCEAEESVCHYRNKRLSRASTQCIKEAHFIIEELLKGSETCFPCYKSFFVVVVKLFIIVNSQILFS